MSSEKPHFSWTQLNMAGRCLMQFFWRYMMGLILAPGFALIVGSSTHKGIQVNMEHKLEHGELLPVEAVQDLTRDAVVQGWEKSGVSLSETEKEKGWQKVQAEAIDLSVSLGALHHRVFAPDINPVHVERGWRIEIKGFSHDILGYIDIQEENLIIDTKTSGKTPPPDDAETDEQLTVYALAASVLDKKIPPLRKDYLIKTKQPKTEQLTTTRTPDDFKGIFRRMEILERCIERGDFYPTTVKTVCNPHQCGYYDVCMESRRRG